MFAYAAAHDDKRPIVTTKARIAEGRIDAARQAINATNPAPCTTERRN